MGQRSVHLEEDLTLLQINVFEIGPQARSVRGGHSGQ